MGPENNDLINLIVIYEKNIYTSILLCKIQYYNHIFIEILALTKCVII